MAESTIVTSRCDLTLLIEDGTSPTALSYTVAIEPGDFSFTPARGTYTPIMDRCAIAGHRKTGYEPGSISFSIHHRNFTGSSDGSLIDLIDGTGAFSARVTVDGSYESALKLTATWAKQTLGDNADQVGTFEKVYFTWDFAEGDPNVVNIQGVVLEAPTFTGGTGA